MNNIEVEIMVLMLDRKRQIAHHVAEVHIRRALAERPNGAERADRDAVLQRARQVASHALRTRWRWPEPRWDAGEPCVTGAD